MSEFTRTATNVEEDAMQLTQIFSKAANAIVEASNLRKEVAQMQAQITQLSSNVDHLRESNERLVEELSAIRQEKTDVQNKLWDAENEIRNLKASLEQATRLNSDQGSEIAKHKETIARLMREVQDSVNEWHKSEENVTALRAQIDRMQEAQETFSKEHEGYLDALRASHARMADVMYPPKAVVEDKGPSDAPFIEQKETSTTGDGNIGPFENGIGTVTSGTVTEQPRDELNRFEPIPMAAKDFEF